jgi:hypothetical protein
MSPAANSDGLIKCLRQPGLLQSQPLKSMREKFIPFIEFPAPRLFRLSGQSLRGLRADAQVPLFLLAPRLFHRDSKLHYRLSGLGTVSQLHRDPRLRVRLPGLAKNSAPRRRRHLIKPPGR